MTIAKTIVLRALSKAQEYIVIPLARWASVDMVPAATAATMDPQYVTPDASISAHIIALAMKDREEALSADPERFQSELNALLEAARHHEALKNSIAMFFVSLMQKGYPMEEVMLRSSANTIHLGMFLRERLGDTTA